MLIAHHEQQALYLRLLRRWIDAAAALEQLDEIAFGQRAAEQETLYFFATEGSQEAELPFRFDSFGDHRHLQAVGHADHGARDGRVSWIGSDVGDETAVDLNALDRQLL